MEKISSVELTDNEIEALKHLIDVAVRTTGLACVPTVMQIMSKVQTAKPIALTGPESADGRNASGKQHD